jgi:uncharacterized membrane protein
MNIISVLLKIGFYLSMIFMFFGIVVKNSIGLSNIGIVILVFTPILLIFSLSVFYFLKKDYKKVLIALFLMAVLLVNITL